jgi:hypothetical protein
MPFAVEFRRFNYADWYPDWLPTTDAGAAELLEQNEQQQNVIMNEDERLFWESRNGLTVEAAFPNPYDI